MSVASWKPLTRNFDVEAKLNAKERSNATAAHPLLPHQPKPQREIKSTKANNDSSTKKGMVRITSQGGDDPLSMMGGGGGDPLSDPLSMMSMGSPSATSSAAAGSSSSDANKDDNNSSSSSSSDSSSNSDILRSWETKKAQIRNDYKVIGNITLSGSNIREFAGSGVEDGSSKKQLDIYSQRLATLERKQMNEDTVEMSQKEMESHIGKLFRDLERAWGADERVLSLKISIQLAKLLVDTTVPQFYPSMFVMVTEKLDKFGTMVFNRLKTKSEEIFNDRNITNSSTSTVSVNKRKSIKLIADFKSADVPTEAKETCRNWFYKIACIRELLPRIYVEIALLKCYRFLADSEYQQIFLRIGSLIRGLGNPLVSLYCRLYLVVVGLDVAPHVVVHTTGMLQDILFTCQMLKDRNHAANLAKWKINEKEFSHLMAPAIDYLLKLVGKHCHPTKDLFQSLLQSYRDYSMDLMVLKNFIEGFDGSFYAHGALGMVTLIKSATVTCISPVDAYAALARQLVSYPPPEEQKIPLLNEVWKVVSKSEDIAAYIRCCTAWVDVVQKHYSEREVLILMSDCSNKLTAFKQSGGEIPDSVSSYLESLVTSIMTGFSVGNGNKQPVAGEVVYNIDAIFTSEHFLKILDSFKGPRKVLICKDILQTFKKHKPTGDAILINCLFDIGRTLHDSVDVLSPEGEKKHISSLLNSFIDKIDFGRDLEGQLGMYVECRAIFCNLDLVKDNLIVCVCNLAMKAHNEMRGNHTKKTSSFVKACLAYCHITIPSISDAFRKLELLLHCAAVALKNQCLPQTDTCLKSAISLIPELPPTEEIDGKHIHTEERLVSVIKELLSILVVAPGHPDHGPFYVVKGLFNALPKYQWQPHSGVQVRVYIEIMALLCTYAQTKFPYHLQKVESNDELYANSAEYMQELDEFLRECIDEILKLLSALVAERNDAVTRAIQCRLIMELSCQLVARMEITHECAQFMNKLLELCVKNKATLTARGDVRYVQACSEFILAKIKGAEHAAVLQPVLRTLLAIK